MCEDLLILTVHHKQDKALPIFKKYFSPIQVGKAFTQFDMKVLSDDIGNQISEKNKYYSELTAMYWAWKNTHSSYVGLMHYRRFFSSVSNPIQAFLRHGIFLLKRFLLPLYCKNVNFGLVSSYSINKVDDVERIAKTLRSFLDKNIGDYDLILPNKTVFHCLTVEQDYALNHNRDDFVALEQMTKQLYPELATSFDQVKLAKSLYPYNMFIMKRHFFEDYCEKLFGVLFALEDQIILGNKSDYQKRVFGFLSERFFNVYVTYLFENKKISCIELDTVFIEG